MRATRSETRPHLYGLLPEQLEAHLAAAGVTIRAAEARRVLAHAIAGGRDGFPAARPVPRAVEEAVDTRTTRAPLALLERVEDPADGFVKYLFGLPDGARVEAVRIPLDRPDRFSVCLSSQAGCAMGCRFCATGRLGLRRNLATWEIVAQLVAVRRDTPGRVTGTVFQGQGEPLANLDAVLHAADVLAHPCGGRVAAEAVTLSTVGVVPGILRLAAEGRRERLIVSLTSAVPERRRKLVPAGAAWSLGELRAALGAYQAAVGGRITLAWVVLGGVNHGPDEVEALGRFIGDLPVRLDLIDVNDPRPDGYRRATPEELGAFRDGLRTLGVPVARRYSGGAAAHAACGMLESIRCADR